MSSDASPEVNPSPSDVTNLECFNVTNVLVWRLNPLPKPVFGPVFDLRLSRRRSRPDVDERFGRGLSRGRGFPPLFAAVCDGEASLSVVVETDARQEVGGDVLRLDPGAGAHLGFSALVERHEPVASRAVVPVDDGGVGVVAVLLETLPELTVVREPLLLQTKEREREKTLR